MFKKDKQDKQASKENKLIIQKPTLRDIESMFVSDDYPLKGKKPNQKF